MRSTTRRGKCRGIIDKTRIGDVVVAGEKSKTPLVSLVVVAVVVLVVVPVLRG